MKGASTRHTDDLQNVNGRLATAIAHCEEAGHDDAVAELKKARKKVSEQIERIEKKAASPAEAELTPEELAKLEKEGDPNCPKGQAYKHRVSGKQIRCTGDLPIEMGRAAAEKYFVDGRGWRAKKGDDPKQLELEYGAEKMLFRFDSAGSSKPAQCIQLWPPPGRSWQEAVSRISGANPQFLKKSGKVKGRSLDVEEGENKLVVSIGDC